VHLGFRERDFDLLVVYDVELLNKQLLGSLLVLQVGEDFELTKSRNDSFTTGKDSFDEALAETRRSPSNCEKSPLSMGGRSGCRKHVLNQTLVFAKVIGGRVVEQRIDV
jgi:hypothetical protein